MALAYRIFSMNCHYIRHITKPVKWGIERQYSLRVLASGMCYSSNNTSRQFERNDVCLLSKSIRQCSSKSGNPNSPEEQPKPGLLKRLKIMYRDYWYVTVPVHCVTSAMWFGGFYYIVSSGVDVLSIMESYGISETLTAPLKEHGSAGYVAVSLALYKLVTPLRYAVTLGGTTFSIKQLESLGWIKPVPTKERLKEMYQEKKDNFQDRKQHYQFQMKERRTQLLDEMRRYKQEMKNRVKKM